MELYLISVLWLLIKPQKRGETVYYIESVTEHYIDVCSRSSVSRSRHSIQQIAIVVTIICVLKCIDTAIVPNSRG